MSQAAELARDPMPVTDVQAQSERLLMPRLRLVPMTLLRGQLAEHLYGVRPEGDLPELDQKIPALLEHAGPTGVVAVPALQGTEVGQGKRDGSRGAHLAAQLDRGVEMV